VLAALAVVLVLAGAAVAFVALHKPGDVSNPKVVFRPQPTATPTPTERRNHHRASDRFVWPFYGYTADRTRALDVSGDLRPPYKRIWAWQGFHLLEFPPVMQGRRLFILTDNGRLQALDKHTGKGLWHRSVGALAASSPAIAGRRIYVTVLQRKGSSAGRVLAVDGKSGRVAWSRNLPSRTESSPVVANGTVYFGSENGTVYALKTSNGGVRWTYHAAGAVKGGVALKDGRVFFGDYAGRVYALGGQRGHVVWTAKTHGAHFGFSAGRFYATPAVAYGRVYLGNVDGNVYSFSEDHGELAWRTHTNGYVYSSAAVGAPPGGRPTVYVGSYDGTFYAMDARTGAVRWRYASGGRISGGPTLLGNTIYYSDLGNRRTLGLNARNGHRVFEFPTGGYNPVISDGRTLYFVGYTKLFALRPLSDVEQARRAKRARERRRAARARAARVSHRCAVQARKAHRHKRKPRHRAYERCVKRHG
jgi:outer membrane protein assembly factor BamB